MSWEPLAGPDPLPGSPEVVLGASTLLGELGAALEGHAATVSAVDPGSWDGLAGERFVAMRDESGPRLVAAAARCSAAAEVLFDWSGTLAEAQVQGTDALRIAVPAEADRVAAVRGLVARAAFEAGARADAAAISADPTAAPVVPEAWTGPDWAGVLAEAEADLDRARDMLADAVRRRDEGARQARAGLAAAADDDLGDPWSWLPMGLRGLLGGLFGGAGTSTLQFVVTDRGLVLNTTESWRHQAYLEAGIDGDTWDPTLGLGANDANARAAWEYYRTLYESDPERYQWAGLAFLAGATVYAGVQDLSVVRDAIRDGADAAQVVQHLAPLLPAHAVEALIAEYGLDGLAGQLDDVEATYMDMQRQIFDDIAWQHVAYRDGGLAAMESLAEGGDLRDDGYLEVWRNLDTGDPALVGYANERLAFIEQHDVIGDDFDELRNRNPVTWAVTMGMSLVAESPVPGGDPFREVVPSTVGVTVDLPDRVPVIPPIPPVAVPDWFPGPGFGFPGNDGVYIDTPDDATVEVDLPVNNVSIFDNRWTWITEDMLPAYDAFLAGDGFADLEGTSLAELARGRRVVPDSVLPYDP